MGSGCVSLHKKRSMLLCQGGKYLSLPINLPHTAHACSSPYHIQCICRTLKSWRITLNKVWDHQEVSALTAVDCMLRPEMLWYRTALVSVITKSGKTSHFHNLSSLHSNMLTLMDVTPPILLFCYWSLQWFFRTVPLTGLGTANEDKTCPARTEPHLSSGS